ncbi:MAG: glycosyltransferase, partial [Patescibacteria group bacterium]
MAAADKIVAVTGGHFAPAYSVTKALISRGSPVLFFGRASVFEDGKDRSLEKETISPLTNVQFISLDAPRITSFVSIFRFITACFEVFKIFILHRPSKIISFGGYVSFPVCIVGYILFIPIFLHEQTIMPGKANTILARFAKKIFVSFPEALNFFPRHKTMCIGNPLRERYEVHQKPLWYPKTDKPLLLILGGSSGSHSLNLLIKPLISELSKKYCLIHQIGDSSYGDYEDLRHQTSKSYIP